ncbi:MAG: HlyD family efflux transporter periplasmic adaptor subunit [Planctomycetota bacterium]
MTDARTDLDLASLSRQRTDLEPPRRSRLRVALPVGILGVFGAVLASSLGDLFARGVEVRVVTPRPAPDGAAVAAPRDRVLVQAAGWIEPDPFLVHVAALAPGVVEEVLVQESDVVEPDQVVARLVDDDAQLAVDRTAAELAQRQAELADARVRSRIARERFDAALEVKEAAAVAAADAEGKAAEAEHRRAAVAGAEADVALAADEVVVQEELAAEGAAGTRQVELAEGALAVAKSRLAIVRADAALADADAAAARARHERAVEDVRLRFDDRLERDRAETGVASAEAAVRLAEARLAEARLALDRMLVRSPVGGVVLERLTVPGMVLDVRQTGHEVCSLYDPASLRVRVDVPQDDVDRLFVGQRAEVVTNARSGRPYAGEVIRLVQLADIQKVTLEAQVRIEDGDALLRPDMLAQVRFFGSGSGGSGDPGSAGGGSGGVFLIPARLVEDGAVWVLDPTRGVAERREVELGAERGGEVEVLARLDATTKVLDPGTATLEEGARVRVRGGTR